MRPKDICPYCNKEIDLTKESAQFVDNILIHINCMYRIWLTRELNNK